VGGGDGGNFGVEGDGSCLPPGGKKKELEDMLGMGIFAMGVLGNAGMLVGMLGLGGAKLGKRLCSRAFNSITGTVVLLEIGFSSCPPKSGTLGKPNAKRA
jgi:hypothetical protein